MRITHDIEKPASRPLSQQDGKTWKTRFGNEKHGKIAKSYASKSSDIRRFAKPTLRSIITITSS
jgi:hypothetical protein